MNNIGLLLTFALAVSTAWVGFARYRTKPDNNWPLLYYFALVAYLNAYDLVLEPLAVYVCVVCALLLRFEFMNERVVFFVKMVETVALTYTGWLLIQAVLRSAQ